MRLLRLLVPVAMVVGLAAFTGAGSAYVLSVTRGTPPVPTLTVEHGTSRTSVENQRDIQTPPATAGQAERNNSFLEGRAPIMAYAPSRVPSQTNTTGIATGALLLPWGLFLATVLGAVVIVARVRRSHRNSTEDLALVQEIHDGLQHLEMRIEALETLVVDDRVSTQARRL